MKRAGLLLAAFAAALPTAPASAGSAFDSKAGVWTDLAAAVLPGAAGEFLAVVSCKEGTIPTATLAWSAPLLGVIPLEKRRAIAIRCDGAPHAYRVAVNEAFRPTAAAPQLRLPEGATASYAGLVPVSESMAYVPPGVRAIGAAWDDPERARIDAGRAEKKLAGYWIDRYEYPNIAGSLPRTLVGSKEAVALCADEGKRLCSADEWESACEGPESSRFATGGAFDAAACGITGEDDAFPRAYASGSKPACVSGWGVFDLGGNVSELVSDRAPLSFNEAAGLPWLRGANWSGGEASARCAARDHFHYQSLNGNEEFYDDGFRCCADGPIVGQKTKKIEPAPPAAAPPPAAPRDDWLRHKGLFVHIRDKSISAEVQKMIAVLKPAKDPRAGMVEILSGPFKMGSKEDDPDRDAIEWPMREVNVEKFWIDAYEFPNKKGERPVTNVTWYEARALCDAVGKRLCAEEEWEKACKGPESLPYPYGAEFDVDVCDTGRPPYNISDKGPAGAKPACVSGYGVHDLSGNVNEWTAGAYAVPYSDEVYRMLRGGDWGGSHKDLRCASRSHFHDATQWYPDDGLRCCWSPPTESPAPKP